MQYFKYEYWHWCTVWLEHCYGGKKNKKTKTADFKLKPMNTHYFIVILIEIQKLNIWINGKRNLRPDVHPGQSVFLTSWQSSFVQGSEDKGPKCRPPGRQEELNDFKGNMYNMTWEKGADTYFILTGWVENETLASRWMWESGDWGRWEGLRASFWKTGPVVYPILV